MIAHGLIFTPEAYLKDGWNCLDGVIVLSSLISMLGAGGGQLRILRVVRVLRPLRLIARFAGMRMAITMLMKAIPKVLDVAVVFLLFLDVFAILGVQVRDLPIRSPTSMTFHDLP